jgi:hypothetical protein
MDREMTAKEKKRAEQLERVCKVAEALRLARELALQLEADKHRDQPELLEVRVLNAIEELEK